jgi:hypothetical protein
MEQMKKRPSKHSRAFADAHDLSSPDPNTWTQEQYDEFQAYVKRKDQERQHEHYQKRRADGRANYTPVAQLNPKKHEQRKKNGAKNADKTYQIKKALRAEAIEWGFKEAVSGPIQRLNVSYLRDLLARKLSIHDIKTIEKNALADQVPKERKPADENGHRKPGPARNADGQDDPEVQRRRAMGCEAANSSYVRARALYDAAHEFAAMQPFDDYTEKIETFRRILRSYKKTELEIAVIEAAALQEYEETHDDERTT